MTKRDITLGSLLAILASAVGIYAGVPWGDVLPYSRAKHDADMAAVEQQKAMSEKAILDAIAESRLEWRCDEWMEELEEKLEQQHAGDDSPILAEAIERLRRRINDNDCDQFDR